MAQLRGGSLRVLSLWNEILHSLKTSFATHEQLVDLVCVQSLILLDAFISFLSDSYVCVSHVGLYVFNLLVEELDSSLIVCWVDSLLMLHFSTQVLWAQSLYGIEGKFIKTHNINVGRGYPWRNIPSNFDDWTWETSPLTLKKSLFGVSNIQHSL